MLRLAIKGQRALQRNLKRKQRDLVKKQKGLVRQATKVVRRRVKANAPRRTGVLRRSVRMKVRASRSTGVVSGRVFVDPKGRGFYGKFFEHGVAERFHKSGKSTGSLPRHAFFDPGVEQSEDEVFRILGKIFKVL